MADIDVITQWSEGRAPQPEDMNRIEQNIQDIRTELGKDVIFFDDKIPQDVNRHSAPRFNSVALSGVNLKLKMRKLIFGSVTVNSIHTPSISTALPSDIAPDDVIDINFIVGNSELGEDTAPSDVANSRDILSWKITANPAGGFLINWKLARGSRSGSARIYILYVEA